MRSLISAAAWVILAATLACAPSPDDDQASTPAADDALPGAAAAPSSVADPVAEVFRFRDEHMTTLIDTRDMERILSHFTEDASYVPPGRAALVGREAIGEYLREFFSRALVGVRFENHEAHVQGDLAVLRDSYDAVVIPRAGGQTQHRGEDVWVLRRIDGEWRIASVIWTAIPATSGP